jgi:putative holliday junction resolvase
MQKSCKKCVNNLSKICFMILIGVDYGKKRVGISIARDPYRQAFPFKVLEGKGAEGEIANIVRQEKVGLVVVGLPLSLQNTDTEQSIRIRTFVRRLGRRITVPIVFEDETLSSETAKEQLGIEGEPSVKLRESGRIDAHSAAVILQSYLDRNG